MQISSMRVGAIQTNCYFIESQGECLVVDPGASPRSILGEVERNGYKLVGVVLTHNHWDHTGGLPDIVEATGVTTYAHELDADGVYCTDDLGLRMSPSLRAAHQRAVEAGYKVDVRVKEGDEIKVGESTFTVIHTPGHTVGSMCLYCADEKVLISGDTLFAGGRHGRTDFATGSAAAMSETLRTKFVDIPDDVAVLPGHEGTSSMQTERRLNPELV